MAPCSFRGDERPGGERERGPKKKRGGLRARTCCTPPPPPFIERAQAAKKEARAAQSPAKCRSTGPPWRPPTLPTSTTSTPGAQPFIPPAGSSVTSGSRLCKRAGEFSINSLRVFESNMAPADFLFFLFVSRLS